MWHGLKPLKLNTGDKWLPCCWECNFHENRQVKWSHKIYLCTRTRSVDPCNNAYCMQPSFTELALCTPCSRLWQRECARPLWRVLRDGASVALCAVAAKSVPTHFITSLFLSFSLPLSLRSILECHRQASRHFCIYFLLLFIHGLAQQQQSWGKSISHTTSAPLKCLIIFFHGSLWDGGGGLWNIYKTWLGWEQENGNKWMNSTEAFNVT